MQKWEYKTEATTRLSAILSASGLEGWELVGVYGDKAVFKRPIVETSEDTRPHHNIVLSHYNIASP